MYERHLKKKRKSLDFKDLQTSSTGTRTGSERALFLRGFCESQNLGEQFGEQTAILEQILTLFEKLDAERQAALLDVLQGRIQTAAE